MKYAYAYKSSDGVRHEASLEAESREAAFAALRSRGIRPIKVVAGDGSKANGEVRGVRRRAVAWLVALVALGVGAAAFFGGARSGARSAAAADSAPRHQLYGDPAIVSGFERGEFGGVLTNRADQLLAWFAQPGKLMCPRDVDPRLFAPEFAKVAGTGAPCRIAPDEPREARELKQIVNGMREELRAYLANGNGTPRSYWRRLLERTQQEVQIYERTRRELEREQREEVWEERNAALRQLGLRTIAIPERE